MGTEYHSVTHGELSLLRLWSKWEMLCVMNDDFFFANDVLGNGFSGNSEWKAFLRQSDKGNVLAVFRMLCEMKLITDFGGFCRTCRPHLNWMRDNVNRLTSKIETH